ncbi:MAG TPA: ammonium transporter [Candidatus Poseidoniales archaeon]|nr:MAG: ammonium transporter [Euryarchaeota archaeon]PXY77120.1 MAG: ammonium transporter [Euryarchaeota archaeon]PXY77808.1 MAG: ammonium transporter [Euryarchaeota archaeon]HHZ73790.1 ammonium transporter [Candidatus Poseidoniales archaeon]HIO58537.1 ammonium transporter [Candidatus Poseidoniales archaeon]
MSLDTGDTGFMLVATALVMIMTPGLAFFYGGLVSRKNVLAVMMQSYVSMGVTTILWVTVGYSLCFSGGAGGIIGNLDLMFLKGISPSDLSGTMPTLLFVVYQMMFAVITPALITGAFANRITFKAYLIFLVAWQLFVYFPFVHMIWGGGMLADWGVLDFAGGIVVHALAGMAALASVLYVGSRQNEDEGAHNVPFVALGAALLWFGWFGFNAGSELAVDGITALAFINTQIAAGFAAITWLLIAWHYDEKPSFVEMLIGMIAGLATITPAAGFVSPQSAMVIGVAAGVVCYFAVVLRKKKGLDDALDVWGVHGVGGCLGIIMLGVLASTEINPAGADGLISGSSTFFMAEVGALALACAWAFIFTYGMLYAIDQITPVRVEEGDEASVDEALHGEAAYID